MDPRALIAWEAGDHRAPVSSSRVATPYLQLDQLDLGDAGDRFAHNLAALRLLHELEHADRSATRAEQIVLARFSAFGDSSLLSRLTTFDGATRHYTVAAPYRSFLDHAALRSLRRAARTAFYTPYDVITTIWQALLARDLAAIAEPRILEPACGVGAFLTAMPPALRARARITAVELDTVAAKITAQLHPDITLHAGVGYETVGLAPNSIDLAISNVPFGAIPVIDRALPPVWCRTIHDYCALRRA
jgi:hypothetical protein